MKPASDLVWARSSMVCTSGSNACGTCARRRAPRPLPVACSCGGGLPRLRARAAAASSFRPSPASLRTRAAACLWWPHGRERLGGSEITSRDDEEISDKPGNHDFDLLRKLVLPDGSILRAKLPGRPSRDCLFSDPARDGKSILKIWNLNEHSGVIGAFNCQGAGWCRAGLKNLIHDVLPGTITGAVTTSVIITVLIAVARVIIRRGSGGRDSFGS